VRHALEKITEGKGRAGEDPLFLERRGPLGGKMRVPRNSLSKSVVRNVAERRGEKALVAQEESSSLTLGQNGVVLEGKW